MEMISSVRTDDASETWIYEDLAPIPNPDITRIKVYAKKILIKDHHGNGKN